MKTFYEPKFYSACADEPKASGRCSVSKLVALIQPASAVEIGREGCTVEELAALFTPHGLTPLHTDYFLPKSTTDRMLRAWKLPLSDAQSREDLPFGIRMLFQKAAGQ